MIELFIVLFLIGFVWILFAVVHDLRTTEVPDWLNFSLALFGLSTRFFYSLFYHDFSYFYQGIIWLGIFFVLGIVLYYIHTFAAGDAKLFISLGAILPIYNNFSLNIKPMLIFVVLFFVVGSLFSLLAVVFFTLLHPKKVFSSFLNYLSNKVYFFFFVLFFVVSLVSLFFNTFFFVLIFILYIFYILTLIIDSQFMQKYVSPNELMEGDWLVHDVVVGGKVIRATWHGLDKKDIELFKKHKKEVLIRQGVCFTPVFLISYIIFIFLYLNNFYGIL